MKTVEIAVGDDRGKQTGTRTVRARPTPVPGLVITGDRGNYTITHKKSGRRVCSASLYNYNASLKKIREAMARTAALELSTKSMYPVVDWTRDMDQLRKHLCSDWVRAFSGTLAYM